MAKTRESFMHCHACRHCHTKWSSDAISTVVSVCDIYGTPTYNIECAKYAEATDTLRKWKPDTAPKTAIKSPVGA